MDGQIYQNGLSDSAEGSGGVTARLWGYLNKSGTKSGSNDGAIPDPIAGVSASDENASVVNGAKMKVLTAKGEKFQVSEEVRSMLALLEDGRLFISKTHAFNAHVRGFIGRLRQLNHEHTVINSELSVIAGFYEQKADSDEHSDLQRAAKSLFEKAVAHRSSDIHIRVSKRTRSQIYFRIHNDLEFVEEHPYEYGTQLCNTIYHAMADVSDTTLEELARQDARISEKSKMPASLDGIRIATSPQVDGYIMVLRLLYNDTTNDLDLGKLGYAADQIDAVEYMKKRPTGVIVIGGPTGSGKSTTLQRVLGSVIAQTQGRKHIITVEDPPEYPIVGAVQTPVTNADSEEERSKQYQKAIKAAMRLDPDIIMLSEVRDNPTAKLVIQAAMTGHQVWTTVHANSALAIIDRLRDLGVNQDLLTDPTIVGGLICQRLVKLLCPHCKKPLIENQDLIGSADMKRFMSVLNIQNVHLQGDGCSHCRNTGTIGRTVVAETVVTDNQLMSYIKNGDRIAALEYIYKDLAIRSMLKHAIEKINDGLVDPFQAEDIVGALNAINIERDHRITPSELQR